MLVMITFIIVNVSKFSTSQNTATCSICRSGTKSVYTVLISARRNQFILNKFLVSDKILITCRELYFEVAGHVYLIKMGYFPEKEMFSVKDHVQNDTC